MILREPCLPAGWYPRNKAAIEEFLEPFTKKTRSQTGAEAAAMAVMAPHAGWYYSGSLAALAVSALDPHAQTVVVIGGHLGGGMPVLVAQEDGVKTPFGVIEIDTELRGEFEKQLPSRPDKYQDNTVEVLLPMVQYFFPGAKLLWLRFPADLGSFDAGITLGKIASDIGRRIVLVASTDLTHYGLNYGFSPKGNGKTALDWVKNVNDASFIKAVLEGNPSLILKRAEEDYSACSAGSVLGALGFTSPQGKNNRCLLEYRNSADMAEASEGIPSSFVGYAAIRF